MILTFSELFGLYNTLIYFSEVTSEIVSENMSGWKLYVFAIMTFLNMDCSISVFLIFSLYVLGSLEFENRFVLFLML